MENDQLLRLYVADPDRDADGNAVRPFFSNAEIDELLTRFGDDVYGASAEGWRIKAGRAVELVNSTTDNSTFSLSDVHKHCMAMVDHYSGISTGGGPGAEFANVLLSTQPTDEGEGDDLVEF
jgi:hypothetical protein